MDATTPADASRAIATGSAQQPCIIFLDSAKLHHAGSVYKYVRKYLQIVWDETRAATDGPRTFDAHTIPGVSPQIPQQMNDCDCGVYLLHFVEKFLRDPPNVTADFFEETCKKGRGRPKSVGGRASPTGPPSTSAGGAMLAGDWFPLREISEKRALLRGLILRLAKEQGGL